MAVINTIGSICRGHLSGQLRWKRAGALWSPERSPVRFHNRVRRRLEPSGLAWDDRRGWPFEIDGSSRTLPILQFLREILEQRLLTKISSVLRGPYCKEKTYVEALGTPVRRHALLCQSCQCILALEGIFEHTILRGGRIRVLENKEDEG